MHWTKIIKSTLKIVILFLIVYVLFLRFADLEVFVTADEVMWLERSTSFMTALTSGNPNDTLVIINRFGNEYTAQGVISRWVVGTSFLPEILTNSVFDPISYKYLSRARVSIALTTLILVILNSYILSRLFKSKLYGIILFFLLVTDIYLFALSRVAHVDALLALLCLLSISTLIAGLEKNKASLILVSGMVAGAAILQKAPALVLVPFTIVAVFYFRLAFFRNSAVTLWVKRLTLWFVGLVLSLAILYPALLTLPMRAVSLYFDSTMLHTPYPYYSEIQFAHHVFRIASNLSIYSTVMLVKSSPTFVVGAFIFLFYCVIFMQGKNSAINEFDTKRFFLSSLFLLFSTLFLFLFCFVGYFSTNRYILPSYVMLMPVTSYGIFLLIRILESKHKLLIYIVLVFILLVQILLLERSRPFYFEYINPVVNEEYQYKFDYGWGVGFKEVAEYFSSLNEDGIVIYSFYPRVLEFHLRNFDVDFEIVETGAVSCSSPRADYVVTRPAYWKTKLNQIDSQGYKAAKIVQARGKTFMKIYKADAFINDLIFKDCLK